MCMSVHASVREVVIRDLVHVRALGVCVRLCVCVRMAVCEVCAWVWMWMWVWV
jgi:hypothetical protein